jgi:carbamate kinase
MTSSPAPFEARPLLVVALGGNALSPPSGDPSYDVEREIVKDTTGELKILVDDGYRLLIVHGNGPQVGRLMRDDVAGENLDVYVAQTQGELGYLIVQDLCQAGVDNCVSLVTRVVVDEDDPGLSRPAKAVGPVLMNEPAGQPSRRTGTGWRLLVGSPRPIDVLELSAVRALIAAHHVVAGGGGGVPVTSTGLPVQGVVDKDWVAALLAIELDADELLFATDVEGVFENFGSADQHLLRELDCDRADRLLASGTLGAGSMAPKVESAMAFVRTCERNSHITKLGQLRLALNGAAGTMVHL